MTVEELISKLQRFNGTTDVVIVDADTDWLLPIEEVGFKGGRVEISGGDQAYANRIKPWTEE